MKQLATMLTISLAAVTPTFAGGYRYYRPTYTKVIKEQAVVVQQPDVFVVQNNNPAPIAAQGETVYRSGVALGGYQQTALPLFDPQSYFSQSIELAKAVNQTAALQSQRTDALVDRLLTAQSATVETLARGEAAARVLQAAGIATVGQPSQQSLGVVITRDQAGQLQVLQLEPEAAEAYASRAATQQQAAAEQPQPGEATPSAPLIAKFCGACHGPQLASPRGSLYLDARPQSVRVIAAEFGMIRDRLLSDMPPADSPQPTQAERQAMLAELTELAKGAQ